MAPINFSGKLPIAVVLTWKGEQVSNVLDTSAKDKQYVLANESVTEINITGIIGAETLEIKRKATKQKRLYDSKLNTYTMEPVSGKKLDRFLDPANGAIWIIDMTFTFRTFFDALLEQMIRTDSTLENFANPPDQAAILDTFEHSDKNNRIRIKYKSATQAVGPILLKQTDVEVKTRGGKKAPSVKVSFEIDFLQNINDVRREAMRKLIAMDWSKMARFGKPGDNIPAFVLVWFDNIFYYLLNHTDLSRGEKFRQAIVNRHKSKTPTAIATELRNDIDKHLITANHWGDLREDKKTEAYQRKISDLFGTLHQKVWLASPVGYLRSLTRHFKASLEQRVQMTLQYGAGHCGEHANTSFSILKEIIGASGSKVTHVVHTGNANIDHAFVVYNLDVKEVFITKTTSSKNTRVKKVGSEITVWNLRNTIIDNPGKKGFLMDPYLDASIAKPTAQELLDALNNKRRKNAGKDTDFLAFGGEFPDKKDVFDLRARSAAERRKAVKHV
jgi:hypothetical protein